MQQARGIDLRHGAADGVLPGRGPLTLERLGGKDDCFGRRDSWSNHEASTDPAASRWAVSEGVLGWRCDFDLVQGHRKDSWLVLMSDPKWKDAGPTDPVATTKTRTRCEEIRVEPSVLDHCVDAASMYGASGKGAVVGHHGGAMRIESP